MKKKVVTAFMMAALGSSLVFSQAVMAADTTAKTETSEDADKDSTESEDKDVAEDADKADEEKEDLKTIGEKPEEDTEGVFSVKLKNLTGKVITGQLLFRFLHRLCAKSCLYSSRQFLNCLQGLSLTCITDHKVLRTENFFHQFAKLFYSFLFSLFKIFFQFLDKLIISDSRHLILKCSH